MRRSQCVGDTGRRVGPLHFVADSGVTARPKRHALKQRSTCGESGNGRGEQRRAPRQCGQRPTYLLVCSFCRGGGGLAGRYVALKSRSRGRLCCEQPEAKSRKLFFPTLSSPIQPGNARQQSAPAMHRTGELLDGDSLRASMAARTGQGRRQAVACLQQANFCLHSQAQSSA